MRNDDILPQGTPSPDWESFVRRSVDLYFESSRASGQLIGAETSGLWIRDDGEEHEALFVPFTSILFVGVRPEVSNDVS